MHPNLKRNAHFCGTIHLAKPGLMKARHLNLISTSSTYLRFLFFGYRYYAQKNSLILPMYQQTANP